MIVTIFRSRLQPEHQAEYAPIAAKMLDLAKAMPGFVAFKNFAAPDGERVLVIEFESEETHNAWRDHPDHRIAQKLGREKFYADFEIQVCSVMRQYGAAME